MSTQNLKFIHLSAGSASAHKADTGAIIFEKASGRIAVADGTNVEYYGGGRVSDAKFENSILTISFNDTAETIKLDFSDVASTSGVHAVLQPLANRVKTLEATVNGTDKGGSHTPGLVDKVAANETAIQANAAAIDLINHETNGILAKAKGYTDTEVKKLKDSHDTLLQGLRNDVNSNDTDIAALQDLHVSDGANGKKTVAQEIIDKVGDIKINDKAVTVKEYVDGKVTDITGTTDDLRTDVNNLKTAVGDSSKGLVKDVTDLKGLHAAGEHNGKATVAEEVTAGVNAKVGTIDGTVKAYVDGKDKDVREYVAGEVSAINGTTGALRTDVNTLKTTVGDVSNGLVKQVNDNETKLTTLIGADANKSVREIANAELAAQLIPEGAKESLDTLQEIAAWIQSHPDSASEMNKKIGDLEGIVGDASNGLVKDVADNTTNINNLKGLHADGKKVADEVTDGIAAIKEASASAGTDVVVTVTTKAGSVSAVAVDASGLRNDLGQKTAAASADTAFGRIKALETTVGEPAKGEVAATGLHKDIADNKSAIKALQDAQASGSLMWSVWK